MINHIYQLIRPKFINVTYADIDISNSVIVRPNYLALCHADQRYYQGKRDPKILEKKLPMALVHECCGTVIADFTNTFSVGDKVVLIPNQPPKNSDEEFFENYMEGTKFLSSGHNGFMQELVAIAPDRVVKYDESIADTTVVISEFISVGMHAVTRLIKAAHNIREKIAVIGDGSLAYVVANILKYRLPESKIVIIGRHQEKLNMFSYIGQTYISDSLPDDLVFDHAFECCGGDGSEQAINTIIDRIHPQGTVVLMGVSENHVAINTRDILEKGLTLIGSSRSGREDFERTVEMLKEPRLQRRFSNIISEVVDVKNIEDIHKAFGMDLTTPFKTVIRWLV